MEVLQVNNTVLFHPGSKILPILPRKLRRRLTRTRLLSDAPLKTGNDCVTPLLGSSLRVTPQEFGADPTGRKDSTDAVAAALAVCVNASRYTPGEFPDSARDARGCTVDLDGGEFLISKPLFVPAYTSNLRVGWGSLVANADSSTWEVSNFGPTSFASRQTEEQFDESFLIVVGGDVPCDHMQGSCNEDIGFPGLFLDGSHVAGGIQINNVMGTTIGPQTYLLNFTGYGVQVNGGHEVMFDQTWLGETNFDFQFTDEQPPLATAIQINSNDHYILDSIVFSSLIGLDMGGAANMVNGLHVWFPWNEAGKYSATAFLDTGSQNRYRGCYIDGSKAVLKSPSMITWNGGFNLGGSGIEISGDVNNLEISGNEFIGGSIHFKGEPGTVVDTVIGGNFYKREGGRGSTASLSQTVASPQGTFQFNFCDNLVFANITRVRSSFTTSSVSSDTFPLVVARSPIGCKVQLDVSPPAAGTLLVDVDTSDYVNYHAH